MCRSAQRRAALYLDLYEQNCGTSGLSPAPPVLRKSGDAAAGIIAALAIKHSPKRLQLLLIDAKGGASLAQLAQLPRTAGAVTRPGKGIW